MTVLRAQGFLSPPASKAAKRILRGAAEGIAPFRPKYINLMYDFDIDHNIYRLIVELVGEGWVVVGEVPMNRDDFLDDPNGLWGLREEIKRQIRYRPDYYDLAPLITLGEN